MLTSNCAWIGICNEHPVSDATASFQLTPSGATALPIAACIRDIAPGPRSSNPTSLNNVDHALKHHVEPPRCIACLLESPACQKKPPTLTPAARGAPLGSKQRLRQQEGDGAHDGQAPRPVLAAAAAARRHAQEGQVGTEASSFQPSETVQPARQVSLPSASSWLQCLWRRRGLDGPARALMSFPQLKTFLKLHAGRVHL